MANFVTEPAVFACGSSPLEDVLSIIIIKFCRSVNKGKFIRAQSAVGELGSYIASMICTYHDK